MMKEPKQTNLLEAIRVFKAKIITKIYDKEKNKIHTLFLTFPKFFCDR